MASYREIQDYVRQIHGCAIKTCWIAHMKELCGIPIRKAPNRIDPNKRTNPCPQNVQPLIKEAFIHFGMIAR